MKPKILITVEGGIVQDVSSNTDVDIIIIDYDTDNIEEPVILQRGPQDNLFKNGQSYKLVDTGKFPLGEEEQDVVDYLKREKF